MSHEPNTGVQIRGASVADAGGIGAVHVASWQWAYRGQLADAFLDTIDVARRTASWRRRLAENPRIAVFVADAAGDIVGFCHVGPSGSDEEPGIGELHAIYLLENATRRGIGSALMAVGLDTLREMGFAEAMLWVLGSNEGTRRFYERAGWFDDDGRHTFTLRGDTAAPAARYRIDLTSAP